MGPLLKDWDYEAGVVNARFIEAEDGRQCLQMRMDLGLFQMELTGRPDGARPHGYDSALDYYQTQSITAFRPFRLGAEACAELQQEAAQYYHRYIARMQLRDFDGVAVDTLHNLDILRLVEKYAEDEDQVWDFLQFKPYTLMIHHRADAEKHAAAGEMKRAATAIQVGIKAIRNFWVQQGEEELQKDSYEINTLNEALRSFAENKAPASEADSLRDALENAIRLEKYERAAEIRDRLLALEKSARRKKSRKKVGEKHGA